MLRNMVQTLLLALAVQSVTVSAVPTAASHPKSDYCVPHPATPFQQRETFDKLVHTFYIEKDVATAFHRYIVADYIQHNAYEQSGAANSEAYLAQLLPTINITVLRTAYDNGLGWVHFRADGFAPRPTAIADIFRFNGSCIVEHWDVIETLPANATNPIALF